MKEVLSIHTGEVAVGGRDIILESSAIASCVAVALLDCPGKVGGLAHIMLPGKSRKKDQFFERTRYAVDGIDELLKLLTGIHAKRENLIACIVGGGNVLKRTDDTICESNIRSVRETLDERGIPILSESVGGEQRRRVLVDVGAGIVRCGLGDGPLNLLFNKTAE